MGSRRAMWAAAGGLRRSAVWGRAPRGRRPTVAPAKATPAEVDAAQFIAPRVEGELAFLLDGPPLGPHVTAQQVLAATEAVAPAMEIVTVGFRDWRIALPGTVADNASHGGFSLGPWSRRLHDQDLRTDGMLMEIDGRPAATGVGAAARASGGGGRVAADQALRPRRRDTARRHRALRRAGRDRPRAGRDDRHAASLRPRPTDRRIPLISFGIAGRSLSCTHAIGKLGVLTVRSNERE